MQYKWLDWHLERPKEITLALTHSTDVALRVLPIYQTHDLTAKSGQDGTSL